MGISPELAPHIEQQQGEVDQLEQEGNWFQAMRTAVDATFYVQSLHLFIE